MEEPGVLILKLPFVKNGQTCQLLIARWKKRAVLRLFPLGGNDKGAGGGTLGACANWHTAAAAAPAADIAEIPLIRH